MTIRLCDNPLAHLLCFNQGHNSAWLWKEEMMTFPLMQCKVDVYFTLTLMQTHLSLPRGSGKYYCNRTI